MILEIIAKKRDGGVLTRDEIAQIVLGYVRGEVPDYQVAAWLMACYLRGLNAAETLALTQIMVESGDQLDLSSVPPPTLDKHSTGGVGDKTSLVLVPLLAASGCSIAKMSGRGLGFTGGTIDKLESIPGFRTALDLETMVAQVCRIGCCLAGQTERLVPADKKLYALRDATATVESVPLIASSIMSKKLAGGAHSILLDVKVGAGAFMQTIERARALASTLTAIGRGAGRQTRAVLTDMSQPLGRTVGNALEVREAIETLTPHAPHSPRFRTFCLQLAGEALHLCGVAPTVEAGIEQARQRLDSGEALQKFRQLVEAQGGDPQVVDHPQRLPSAPHIGDVRARESGYLAAVAPRLVAYTALRMGAGRQKKEDTIDPAVGIEVLHSVGEWVEAGEPLFRVHARTVEQLAHAQNELENAYETTPEPVPPVPIILERL